MSILIVLACIALLVLLITYFKVNPFLAFLVVSIIVGLLLGLPVGALTTSIQKGIGDMLGGLVIVIVSGAMLGKLVAESGAAQRIASGLMAWFGKKYIHWALMITGFVIGIPLFYNVGFVLVVPLIFSVAYRLKFPVVYVATPMLAALSVTHGFLPPHPSPYALVQLFHANVGLTLLYGTIIAIPTVILAGPVFARTLKSLNSPLPTTFLPKDVEEENLPGMTVSVLSAMLPVLMIGGTAIITNLGAFRGIPLIGGLVRILQSFLDLLGPEVISFISDPVIVLLFSLAVATYTLGLRRGMSMKKIMDVYGDAVKDIAMVLLIISGAGALKQILIDSGVSNQIASALGHVDAHPLVLGWAMAALIRVCVGSATVAGLTAAGIIAPLLPNMNVDPNLMVLAIGAGSLLFSHVNDSGFWLFKEYFNLSIKDTIRSWSLMETIVAIVGLFGVLTLNLLL